MELLCNLDDEERHNLRDAMSKLEADKEKKLYESEYMCEIERNEKNENTSPVNVHKFLNVY